MTVQPATIQIKYVNQPKEAHWKSGSVKDANDQLWNVLKEHLGYFSQGEVCDILWEQAGKYPSIVGKGTQLFPAQPSQPAPGSAVQPQTAAQAWKAPLAPKTPLTYEKTAEPLTPPILSNILATAVEAGLIKEPEELSRWAFCVRQAVENYHAGGEMATLPESPAHQARSDIDSQYGAGHPDAPPMDDPRFQ